MDAHKVPLMTVCPRCAAPVMPDDVAWYDTSEGETDEIDLSDLDPAIGSVTVTRTAVGVGCPACRGRDRVTVN